MEKTSERWLFYFCCCEVKTERSVCLHSATPSRDLIRNTRFEDCFNTNCKNEQLTMKEVAWASITAVYEFIR
jgi:hypothetical protein